MGKTSGLASIRRRTSDSIGHLPLSLKIGVPLTIVSVLVAGAVALTQGLSASSSIDRHAVANAAGLAKFVDSYVNFAQTPGNPALTHPKDSADQFVRALATTDPSVTGIDRKSTRLNSSHQIISYAVFCLKKKKYKQRQQI